jgi:hypothetical protein
VGARDESAALGQEALETWLAFLAGSD